MQYSTSVWIHIGKAKHLPNSMVLALFKPLCTLYLKPRGYAKWSKCVQIYAIQRKQFSWHKSLHCLECAQFSLVYCGVHGTYAEQFLLQHSAVFCSPYIPSRMKTKKHPKYAFFTVLSVRMCRTCPTKIRMFVSQMYPKLRIMYKKWRLNDTNATCPECAPTRILRYRTSCYTPRPYAHKARKRKRRWKYGPGVIWVRLHKGSRTKMGCSVIKLWPKSNIIHK